jgi:hypothetical protein
MAARPTRSPNPSRAVFMFVEISIFAIAIIVVLWGGDVVEPGAQ